MALPFLVTPSDGPGRCLFLSSHTPNILHEGVPVETHPLFPETPPRCPLRAHWGGEPYRPLHQPSAVLWLYHVRPSLPWCSFITTPCVGQRGVSSVGVTTRGNRCSTASSRASNRPSSLSRRVSCTWRPASSRWTLTEAGASGSGAVGAGGVFDRQTWASPAGASWLAPVAASSFALANG